MHSSDQVCVHWYVYMCICVHVYMCICVYVYMCQWRIYILACSGSVMVTHSPRNVPTCIQLSRGTHQTSHTLLPTPYTHTPPYTIHPHSSLHHTPTLLPTPYTHTPPYTIHPHSSLHHTPTLLPTPYTHTPPYTITNIPGVGCTSVLPSLFLKDAALPFCECLH